MMFLIVFHELNYDQHIYEKEKTGRVLVKSNTYNRTREETSALLAQKLKESIPEVKETVSRIGRPEIGTHPHPVNYSEIHIAFL